MPANGKVSVGWQIVFTFLPIVNLWAFYRIRRLTKYFLYVIVPSIALSVILSYYSLAGLWVVDSTDSIALDQFANTDEKEPRFTSRDQVWVMPPYSAILTVSNVIGWGLQAFAIYLVIIWSRQHNRHFQPDTQPLQ